MKSLNRSLIGTALLTLATVASSPAHAVFVASICDDLACSGGNDITVQDNGAGDTIGALGGISFSTSAFGYSLLVNTSQSKPMIGSAAAPQLDLTFTATSSAAGGGNVFLYTSDTDFVSSGSFLLALGGTNSGGSGSVTGRAWGGSSNTVLQFSGANLIGTSGAQSGSSYSNSVSGNFSSAVNPYSLTIGAAINRTTAGTSTGDLNLQVSAIPEPETYALMLAGLAMLGGVAKRRKLATAA
jgi:PEP-CTERM motif